ncbi:MAG: response regulator [Candidatus Manganitrophus sp.]|nr:response regulator [Candidatus Manganitrophus sp.]MDC4225545.1 response regulator [Candidatus Manganitrophus sp.]WDT73097.1 MAG: response regulator [Candidatus Manganitrophus sp.]WDT74692.1 MAG: response regulator [Candidatus Manganitrophus sp.]
MSSQTLQPVKILLVEDNLQDIEIARRAFAKGRVKNELIVVRDGQEALDYLYHQGKHKDPATSPRPGMILLDLNLPKVGGMEVLQQIKKDETLKSIPVIVLTASPREEDVVRTYNLGVNTYIQKPVEFDNFMRVVHAVQEYWIVIASLPPSG